MYLKKLLITVVFAMLFVSNIYSQQSLDIYGSNSKFINPKFRLNSFESNPTNYTNTIDWDFSFSFGSILAAQTTHDIFAASIGKRLGDHYLYARYTPGFKKSFILNTDSLVTIGDSVKTLNSLLSYEEKYGFGYSYNFTNNFTAGISLRYFEQTYSQDNVYFYFSDTVNTLVTVTDEWKNKYWRADIGLTYKASDNLALSLSSYNLLLLNENGSFGDHENLLLKTDKGVIFGVDYNINNHLFLRADYETSSSFIVGANAAFNLFDGKIFFGLSAFHDKYQTPFIAGIQPILNYSYNSFNLNITAIKYFEERKGLMPVDALINTGIYNVINNQYSYNKINVNLNIALNFKPKKLVKFETSEMVKIVKDIYPTLAGDYLTEPFALGKVVNISDKQVSVKPSSYIHEVNSERIFSPFVTIAPGDTAVIKFYTVINENESSYDKRMISQVDFYLTTIYSDYDDEAQKPILINDRNSWDGKVSSLRYFVKYEYQSSKQFTKYVLQNYKSELDTVPSSVRNFERIKIIFNYFVKNMQYVSDPRASVEHVQFPSETINLKGGDCDDLSVAFSSLLESIGIQTAFVDFKSDDGISHVNLLINTKMKPGEAALITNNDKKYFIRKNVTGSEEIWIPIEMTSLTDFETAWSIGSDKFYKEVVEDFGLAKNKIEIIDIY